MTKVKITFDNYSSSSKRKYYVAERNLHSKSSIREESLVIIRQAQRENLTGYRDLAGDDVGIAIYLRSKNITDAATGFKESGFGIKYSLRPDGSLHVLSGYEPLNHDWTFAELQELVAEGYIEGDPCEILVVLPTGLGAPLQDIFDLLGFMANIYGLAQPASSLVLRIVRLVKDRKIRAVIKGWIANGIYYPLQIREFIDVKPGWKLTEVKRRLKLNDEYAIKLLMSLGYEPVDNIWRLTHTKNSINNRKKWIRNEKKYSKLHNSYGFH